MGNRSAIENGKGFRVRGSGFRVQGSGFRVCPWACRPLIACESSTRQLGVRSGGAAQKIMKRREV